MSQTRLHIMWRDFAINRMFCEQAKFLTNSLEKSKCLVIVLDIQVWNSLAHTSVLFFFKSLTFWCCYNPISLGILVNGVSILFKLGNGEKVRNTLLIEPEIP